MIVYSHKRTKKYPLPPISQKAVTAGNILLYNQVDNIRDLSDFSAFE